MMVPRTLPMTGRTPTGRAGRRLPWLLVVLVGLGAESFGPTPRFEGKAIPNPPRQGEPWTPPETKLPRFLVTATSALFEAGMADPRGCDYREIEIGDARLVKTRGFVLPERPGEAGRFAVGWDGVVYPAFSVGEPGDLEADVRAMANALKASRKAAEAQRGSRFGTAGGFVRSDGLPTTDSRSPLTLCLLLRLGRADLAETLFAAGTVWTADAPRPDLTDYHITFVSLAAEWGGTVYSRLMDAHQRADDVVALDAARRLAAFQKAVDAKAEAMGFHRPEPQSNGPDPVPYIGRHDQLAPLLADQERRAREPTRGPVPKPGGDTSARIAALIRDFDQIHVVQMSNPGSADPGGAPIVRELIAEGDPAVGPLLIALESDTRLTRSMSGRNGPSYVHPVTDAVYAALVGILKTNRFREHGDDFTDRRTPEGRKPLAAAIRAYWEKNRAVPLVERWYRDLLDDRAGPNRWLEAAAGLVQPADETRIPIVGGAVNPRPGQAPAMRMKGEPLREGRDPSVSSLMARRAAEFARAGDLNQACAMAQTFARWDQPAALPTVKTLMAACRERTLGDPQNRQPDRSCARSIVQFTLLRVRAGDREAIDEYAGWIRAVQPKVIGDTLLFALEPMWTFADHPAIEAAARSMFTDPESPWLPLVPLKPDQRRSSFEDPIGSPLACLSAFREALLRALDDREPAGTATLNKESGFSYRMASGLSGGVGGSRPPAAEDRAGVEMGFRVCDVVAWKLSTLEGAPECQLYWDEARRDAAVAACAAYLRRYGPRLSAQVPPDEPDFPYARAHLRFPTLDRPATAEDVREARAIFSIDGQGETRVVSMPGGLPIRARWTMREAFPIDRRLGTIEARRAYLQDGLVWQAEEVRTGEGWERFYGFVGHATIARVPASEIEFPADRIRAVTLPDGLDARLGLVDPPPRFAYPPGRPIVVALRLRNRLGVERRAPTEFVRRADDGKPALRRGLGLVLTELPKAPDRQTQPNPPAHDWAPTRTARFDPGDADRPLAPADSFEVMSIDLNDWFADLGPGTYRLRLTFSADSGLGEGASNDVHFTIGPPDDRFR